VREDRELPEEFFVPDLFNTGIRLPKEEREMMLDMWHLGHDLPIGAGYESGDPLDFIRNDVGGTVFVLECLCLHEMDQAAKRVELVLEFALLREAQLVR